MKNLILAALLTSTFSITDTAYAQGFLDRINNVVNKVDQTISTGERAQRSAERVMGKVPEKETTEETTSTQETASTKTEQSPETVEPATGTTIEEDEEEILRKAREIEERRILEQAERIRQERAARAAND